jgi:hypothetical protein
MLNRRQRMLQTKRAQSAYAREAAAVDEENKQKAAAAAKKSLSAGVDSDANARELQQALNFKQIVVDYAIKVRDPNEIARLKAKLARISTNPANFEAAFANALVSGPYKIDAYAEMIPGSLVVSEPQQTVLYEVATTTAEPTVVTV